MSKEHLTKKAAKSVFWNFISSFGVSGVRFFSTAILARILFPEDFGLVGMAFVFTGFISLFGRIGFGQALMQKQKFDDKSLSTSFWTEQAIGFTLALVCIMVAPFVGKFYKEPAVTYIVMSMSINFIVTCLGGTHSILLYKDLRFKELAQIEMVCTIFRVTVVLTLAVIGFRFWSIILGMIAERSLKTLIYYVILPWRPKLVFCKNTAKELFDYGKHLYGQSFVNFLNSNLDFLVTGRILGSDSLGYYQFAYNLPHLILDLVTSKISDILFPLFSKVKDDGERLRRGLYKALSFQSAIIFPLLFGLIHQANSFIVTAYGAKWLPAVVPLQLLCFCSLISSVTWVSGILLNAKGRPDISFKLSVFTLPFTVLFIVLFAKRWGILGVAVAMTLMRLTRLFLIYCSIKLVQDNLFNYCKNFVPSVVSSVIMLAMLSLSSSIIKQWITLEPILLVVNTVVGAGVYLGSYYLLFPKAFEEFFSFVKQIRK